MHTITFIIKMKWKWPLNEDHPDNLSANDKKTNKQANRLLSESKTESKTFQVLLCSFSLETYTAWMEARPKIIFKIFLSSY